jgi:MFS family permease
MSLIHGKSPVLTSGRIQDVPPWLLDRGHHKRQSKRWQHFYVLPVLLLEFLAIALTRAVLPSMLLAEYGSQVYLIMGFADFVRGLLAFVACPLTGKISDIVGRRICLFVTVLGTCAPACSLAFFSWETQPVPIVSEAAGASTFGEAQSELGPEETADETGLWPFPWDGQDQPPAVGEVRMHPRAITVFVVLLALSGIFSSTFTLVFAYISDTVREQDERVSAYGLALATFGLSFTMGPMAGGYLGRTHKQYVFLSSLVLTIIDLLYIYLVLPESRDIVPRQDGDSKSSLSFISLDHNFSWNPWDTLRIIAIDPFLRQVGKVAFLYYTALWAIISTLSVYAVKKFHLGPERLGELMSALGLCTMVAEAVLVRIIVPLLGEKRSMKVGLVSFTLQ